MIKEKAYAKINISLDVIRKQEDGYHELNTIMTPISLYDDLVFTLDDEITLEANTSIEDNIILKAAFLLQKTYNVKKGARIKLIKRIPIAAGLAGGSADASATLRGLNTLWGLNKSLDELAELSAQIGSDTPFCMYNRLAYCQGRGEKVHFIPANIDSYVLIIKPYFGVSTRDVFKAHTINYQGQERFNNLIETIDSGKWPLPIYNDLMETTFKIAPKLKELYDEIKKDDSSVMMSGSGPTLYILSKDKTHLNKLYRKYVPYNVVSLQKIGLII